MDYYEGRMEFLEELFSGDEPQQEMNFDLTEEQTGEVSSISTCMNMNSRFKVVTDGDVDCFLEAQQNENTKRKTKADLTLFKTFLSAKNELRDPEFIPPVELDRYIGNYLLSVRKKDGSQYEPTTLRCFLSSIDRHLREKSYPVSVINIFRFAKCREVLKSKQKELKCLGKGNKPFASDEITDDDIQQLIEAKQLGPHNPISLINALWLNNCVHFGLRTGKESHDLMWGDIALKEDDGGDLFLEYAQERQTKTRTGANPRNVRLTKPRAYATPEIPERDPVGLYLLYKSKRPEEYCSPEAPFYLNKTVDNPRPDQSWYKKTPMGLNKLYKIMKDMKTGANMTDSNKRLTPYSARKHLVQKLNDEGVPPTQIMQISGHKNVQSINNYSKINANQAKEISHLLSGRSRPSSSSSACQQMSAIVTRESQWVHTQSIPVQSQPSFPGMFVGSTFHAPVTVHFHQYPQMVPACTTKASISSSQAASLTVPFTLPAEKQPSTVSEAQPCIGATGPTASTSDQENP